MAVEKLDNNILSNMPTLGFTSVNFANMDMGDSAVNYTKQNQFSISGMVIITVITFIQKQAPKVKPQQIPCIKSYFNY